MKSPVHLGIDVGTQSVRVMAVTDEGAVAGSAAQPLTSLRMAERHEQSPLQWWEAVAYGCREVVLQLGGTCTVKGLAVSATSGTILLTDERQTPITAALMYDDGRASAESIEVYAAGEALWTELSYRMQPSWALPKLLWLARHTEVPAGARLFHQSDFINACLAGTWVASDASNCLKTGYDLIRGRWPFEILEKLRLDPKLFPEVVRPGRLIGQVSASAAAKTGLLAGTPILSGMTDGCAAQIASGAISPGSWNSVLGTTLVLKGVTRELLHDPLGVVYSHRFVDSCWLPGGASSTGAGALNHFDRLRWDDLDRGALASEPTQLIVYPLAGRGERYPFAAPAAHGFTLGHSPSTAEHYKAVLQGIAFIERLAFDALQSLGAVMDGAFTISGGATRSEALNQIRADVLARELQVPRVTEGAFGMAMLAAASETTLQAVTERMVRIERTITPRRGFEAYADQYLQLLSSLEDRGWLPQELAVHARNGWQR